MPLIVAGPVGDLAKAIERCGILVAQFGGLRAGGRIRARAHPDLKQVTARFQRINQTLEKALQAGHLSAAQERSIARNVAGIAAALEKDAGSNR